MSVLVGSRGRLSKVEFREVQMGQDCVGSTAPGKSARFLFAEFSRTVVQQHGR
jgi:hypothetical protein